MDIKKSAPSGATHYSVDRGFGGAYYFGYSE